MRNKLSLAILALAPMLSAGPAFAADPSPASTTTTTATTTVAPAAKQGRAQVETESRLTDLKGKLQITAGEQQAWDDFASTMRQNATNTDQQMEQRKEEGKLTALASMQAYAQMTQTNADNVQRLLPKFEALYNVLTPAQKTAADDAFVKARQRMLKMQHAG